MRNRCPAWIPMLGVLGLLWVALPAPANGAPVFFEGTPCFVVSDNSTCPTPRFGTIINFDDLATNIPLLPAQYAALAAYVVAEAHAQDTVPKIVTVEIEPEGIDNAVAFVDPYECSRSVRAVRMRIRYVEICGEP